MNGSIARVATSPTDNMSSKSASQPDGPSPRKTRMTSSDLPLAVIREATEADASAIFDLICFKAEFDGCLPSLQSTPRKLMVAMRGTSPYFRALLAEVDGVPVGFATFHQTYSSFLAQPGIWLDDLFVRESHRTAGIGKALMRHLAILAASNGCARIDWIVATGNTNGRAFYNHIGSRVHEDVRFCRLDASGISSLANDHVVESQSPVAAMPRSARIR